MNIFGVSPIEIIVIAVLGLIIFGPERLPEVGRFFGRAVAKVMAWQYTSPEAQMLNDIRRDLEREIIDIRDEMVRARQQLDVRADLQDLRRETETLIQNQGSTATPAAEEATIAPPAPPADPTADLPTLPESVAPELPELPALPELPESVVPPFDAYTPPVQTSEIELLTVQIQALMADMHALQEQLRQHGVLDPTWQPPSHEMQQKQTV